jgi:hypothetical protein
MSSHSQLLSWLRLKLRQHWSWAHLDARAVTDQASISSLAGSLASTGKTVVHTYELNA